MALAFTDDNLKDYLAGDKPVVVDFWAEWCGPCRVIAPMVEELAKAYEGQVAIGKMDVEDCPNTTEEYGIINIPTLLFFKGSAVAPGRPTQTQTRRGLPQEVIRALFVFTPLECMWRRGVPRLKGSVYCNSFSICCACSFVLISLGGNTRVMTPCSSTRKVVRNMPM